MAAPSWEKYLAELLDGSAAPQAKHDTLTELRDNIDFFTHGQEYAEFAPKLIPALLANLDGQPEFSNTSIEQRTRYVSLEVLHRLPLTPQEVVKEHVKPMIEKLLELVRTDNEDNAILCIKTIMDLLRIHSKTLNPYVPQFLKLILDLFNQLEKLVTETFEISSDQTGYLSSSQNSQQFSTSNPAGNELGLDQTQPRRLAKAMESFKVVAECPIAVVSVFQAYNSIMAESVKTFCPVIIRTLLLQVPAQESARNEAQAQGKLLVGVYKGIKNKEAFGELFVAQVKIMSFLAFLLRQYASLFADFLPKTPDIVVRMLQDCPRDRPGARKELIVAFRHIISYSFRRIFLKAIDQLQDERILLGDGLMVQQTIRPLAFSILADLVHHLRDQLTKDQIRFTIQVYVKNLLQDYPGGSFSAMSTKLLLNMSECITRIEPKEDGRHFLMIILNSIGDKFKSMNEQFDNSVKLFKKHTPPKLDYTAKSYLADPDDKPDWDEVDIFNATPIITNNNAERSTDAVTDNRFLIKNLLHGLKTVFYQLRACNPRQAKEQTENPTPSSHFNLNDFTWGYSAEEVKILVKLFHEGIRVFRYFGVQKENDDTRTWEVASKVEEELLEAFATVFHHLDPATFYEVFQPEMDHFYQLILEYRPLSHVAKFLLACEATSPAFASMLIEFLMKKLPLLGAADKKQSEVLLLLFKLFFLAVTLFPGHNESVVESQIVKIITRSLELATTAEEPMNYYALLRNLFRSIGGGRFDQCYTNILPLLEMLLETLNNLLMAARRPQDRDLFVELTLTVPTRLSNLLPYLRYLMKPLGVALRAGPDLVAQGLRTLELCVDNLTADYLDPLMAPALDDLMSALWDHLKPSPYNHFHSHTTLRILGKLAGRNRNFVAGQQALDFKGYTDDESSIDVKLIGTVRDRPLPVSLGISTSIGILEQTSSFKVSSTDIQNAYRLVSSNVKLLIGTEPLPEDLAQLVRLQAEDAYDRKFDVGPDIFDRTDAESSMSKLEEQRKHLTRLICACIYAMELEDVRTEAREFVFGLVRYVAALDSGRKIAYSKHNSKQFDKDSGEGPHFLHPYVLCDAIADALGSVAIEVREAAIETIFHLKEAAEAIYGPSKRPDQFPIFKYLARLFAHRCHKEELFAKAAGTLGLEALALRLGFSDDWLREWQLTFLRALLYVLKDLPYNVPSLCRTKSLEVLVAVVSRCNKGIKVEEIQNPKSNLYAVASLLMYELAHIDAHVRQGARQSFSSMAEVMECKVEEILRPITPRLLQTVFMKPLRTLPFDKQIGYIESITYVFQAGQDLVPVDENLLRLLDGLFVIADAEDTGFAPKPIEYRTSESITKLRIACIRLLTEVHQVLKNAPSEQNQQRRDHIVQRLVQFMNRSGVSTSVMDAAFDSLLVVHEPEQKLPQALLGICLQPIYAVMQGSQQPTADFPDRLSRFLRLFTACFKFENAINLFPLIKHIKKFEAQYVPLQKTSIMPMEQSSVIRLIAGMLDTIHLLPQGAQQYLEPMVQRVFTLEIALRRTNVSPFREPLMHFLEQFPEEAWALFGPQMKLFPSGRFFAQLVGHPLGKKLRTTVCGKASSLVELLGSNSAGDDRWTSIINALHIIWGVYQYPETRAVITKDGSIQKAVLEAGRAITSKLKQNGFGSNLHIAALQASEQAMEIMLFNMESSPGNIDFAFEVIEAVTSDELPKLSKLTKFIYTKWIRAGDIELQRRLILQTINVYANQHGPSAQLKTFLLKNVVNPILSQDVMDNWSTVVPASNGTALVNSGLIEVIFSKLWRTEALGGVDGYQQDENAARAEVLQLTAFLIKYHHNLVQDVRREIIRFGWSLISVDEIVVKYGAYVVLAYFVATFDAPAEMCARVYSALLKAQQNENRAIAAQGLELLANVVSKQPFATQYPRRVISEEYHNGPQLVTSFQFVIRHSDLFYDARTSFAAAIIPSLTKIGPIPGSQPENRRQVLNLIRTIWSWQKKALAKAAEEGQPPASQFMAPYALRQGLVQYLITFIATLGSAYPSLPFRNEDTSSTAIVYPEIPRLAIELLHEILSEGWTDLDLQQFLSSSSERGVQVVWKHLTLDRLPQEQASVYPARLVYTLEIIKVFVNIKSDEWIINNLEGLKAILELSLKEDMIEVQESLHGPTGKLQPIIARILKTIPQTANSGDDDDVVMEDEGAQQFVSYLHSLISEGLEKGNLTSAISILGALCAWRANEATPHLGPLMKVFTGNLVKNHIMHYGRRPDKSDRLRGSEHDKDKDEDEEKEKEKEALKEAEVEPKEDGGNDKEKEEDSNTKEESEQVPSMADLTSQVGLIVKSLDILAARAPELGDLRRNFLQSVAVLVERSQSDEICFKILDISEKWVFEMDDLLPTMKERVAILTKMLTFEQRSNGPLLARYLDLVIRIYDDPKIQRSELTVRLEQAFLVGTRSTDVETRNRFMSIFDKHISRTASRRLSYLLASQDWRSLQDSFWLQQVIQLLLGSIEMNGPTQLHPSDFKMLPPSLVLSMHAKDARAKAINVDERLSGLASKIAAFHASVSSVKVKDIIEPLAHLQHLEPELAYQTWVAIFPLFWSAYPKDGRPAMEKALVSLLTKDDHHRQMDRRPNCIQAILEGITRVRPRMRFPPQIARYLAHTFDGWFTAAHFLEEQLIEPLVDTPRVRETTSDALLDLYVTLHEDDLFYGLWRRRCVYVETNAALSYEQLGMWEKAQRMYDSAQLKARTGALPFSQAEYTLWEDHWVICAQKLQQWEILAEFAKHENLNDLYLEATWRNTEAWNSPDQREQLDSIIKAVSDAPTPRRLYFQCFMTLMKYHLKQASSQDVIRTGDEAMQLSIRKWHQLPRRITNAHVPLLQTFQSLVELMDANVIIGNLGQTTAQNLEQQAIDLKHQLTIWRERLPNFWDDINVWQDLVTWRQHIFHLINSVYLGLLPPGGSTSSNHYRGYHETAWIINRFANVARKHDLTDVCVAQLSRIYTLPNIEIQEAFLKLREQAKCHYQNPTELHNGLDVINNTNLNYFGNAQKSEFHTLKGMFLDKLGSKTEASDAFSNALSFDIKLPKAWAEWGRYHDGLFKNEPFNMEHASSAINCYLEAASLYKNSQSRHLLSRVLWLLSVDNAEKKLEMTFRNFKGEHPFWYWIAFIPQLLGSLLRPQVQVARVLLMKIAKEYPQALYFLLRTARDDFHVLRRQYQQQQQQKQGQAGQSQGGQSGQSGQQQSQASSLPSQPNSQNSQQQPVADADKQAWDHLEDILALIKKTFPLLVLSIESLIDQISKHFKCSPDEDAYRLIVALLTDSLSYVSRNPQLYSQDVKLPATTEANISRFAQSILPVHIRAAFQSEFVTTKPTMYECIHRLRSWRSRLEQKLDARESSISLELLSAHLSEFCFQKFEHVEVPGQYLFPTDSNTSFVRIHRFLPDVELIRGAGVCHRRLKIRGHDGSLHTFGVQNPAARHSRREERTLQLFRVLNEMLLRQRETRRRNLQFELPAIVPITGIFRLIGDDPSAVSLLTTYEDFCRRNKMDRDGPILFNVTQLASVVPKTVNELANSLRTETMLAIQEKFVPHTVALQYFQATFPDFEAFWLFRRRFSYQLAALSFMTFALQLSQRTPQKLLISRSTGTVWGTEMVSSIAASKPLLHNPEPVPFRLTPNMQTVMGPIGTEGIFAPSIMAIARTLTHREGELERTLSLFLRDEVIYWFLQSRVAAAAGAASSGSAGAGAAVGGHIEVTQLRDAVLQNCDMVVNRTVSLAQPPQTGVLPANQTVVDMIARAVDPSRLSLSEPLWMPYL